MSNDEKATKDSHTPRRELDERVVSGVEIQKGVKKVEALQRVWTPRLKVALYIAIALASYMYILDNGTNWAWGSYAASELGHYDLYAAIQCSQAILLAIGKPLFAKLTDAAGRAEAISIALFMYTLGYVISASTPTMTGLGAGNCIWVLGFSGLQIALQIVIADITTLQWRSLVSGLAYVLSFSVVGFAQLAPIAFDAGVASICSTGGWYFINFYANGKISSSVVAGPGWRWGYGIYALCYLPALLPIIVILFWGQHKAKRLGALPDYGTSSKPTWSARTKDFIVETDAIGLFLLAATLALIFLPIVIAGGSYATTTWHNPSIPAMMVIGGVVTLPTFIFFEIKYATHPIMPVRLLRNRNVLVVCAINFFDFVSFYLTFTQLYGFVAATTNWSYQDIIYYTNCQSLSLTFFAILWSLAIAKFKFGFKWSLTFALCVRVLGVGIMLHARNSRGNNTGELVMTQILQGAGGGIAAVASQTAAQGSVPHRDVAFTTAVVLLSAELGNVVGTAAAGAINRNRLPVEIAKRFPLFNAAQVAAFVSSPGLVAIDYPDLNSGPRILMHEAFSAVQRLLIIPALVLAFVPVIASLFTQNFQLIKVQNVVEAKNVTGDVVDGVEQRPELIREKTRPQDVGRR